MTDGFDVGVFSRIRERDLRQEGICIGEGPYVVERMVRAGWHIVGILCSFGMATRAKKIAGGAPMAVRTDGELQEIAGYPFHRGVLAAAIRPKVREITQFSANSQLIEASSIADSLIIVCPAVADPQNLGAIFRSASAFGADALLLGPQSADEYSRRVIRVSMGGVFTVPPVRIESPKETAAHLRDHGYEMVATVVDSIATSVTHHCWERRTALVLGGEHQGLDAPWLDACSAQITIPMRAGTDSLNVGVAAGICMFSYYSRRPIAIQ
jgi:tRNA G18 (ribose-2'-O)-methylase SpoU